MDRNPPQIRPLAPQTISSGGSIPPLRRRGQRLLSLVPLSVTYGKSKPDLNPVLIIDTEKTENAIEIFLVSELDAQFAFSLSDGDVDLRIESIAQSLGNSEELG